MARTKGSKSLDKKSSQLGKKKKREIKKNTRTNKKEIDSEDEIEKKVKILPTKKRAKSLSKEKKKKTKKLKIESSDEENNKSDLSLDEEKEVKKNKRGRKKKETKIINKKNSKLKNKKKIFQEEENEIEDEDMSDNELEDDNKKIKNKIKIDRQKNKNKSKSKEKTEKKSIKIEKKNKSKSKEKTEKKSNKKTEQKKIKEIIKKNKKEESEDEKEEEEEEEENEEEEKEKKTKKGKKISKKDLKKIQIKIDSLPEDKYLTTKSDNLITDCCIICNEKNIFRAIKTNNKKLLEKCLNATKEIYSLNYKLPMLKYLTPLEYCLKYNNKDFFSIILNYFRKPHSRIKPPVSKLNYINTGKQSIYTFGFKTRYINLSRGNRLGNNAFLEQSNDYNRTEDNYVMRKFYQIVNNPKTIFLHDDDIFQKFKNFTKLIKIQDYDILNLIYENLDKGNINIVEYLMSIFTTKENYGFNKLHSLVTTQKKNYNLDIKNKQSTNKLTSTLQITPVHFSCINPNEKILGELIEKGGEIEYQDARGKKPISYAATCKSSGPLKLLIKKKCNVNDREKNGFTPFLHACRSGRFENVKILIENGANILHKPKPGMNMGIHYICLNDNNIDILKYLLDKDINMINMTGSGKKSPLHFAVENNCEKIVEFLINKGCKIDIVDKFRRTPLLLACKFGYTRILDFLIKKGSNVNKGDNSNNSPLHYACAYGNMECVKLLIEAKAKVNELNMWKTLPIEIALLKNHFGIVKYLINNGDFNIDTPFSNGNNILFHSIIEILPESFDEIKYYINEKKANVNYSNDNKMNILHFLSNFSYQAYISNFTNFDEKKKLNEELHKDYIKKYRNILRDYIKLLIDNNCNCDLNNNIGQSPLLLSLENNNFYFAIELIDLCKDKIDICLFDNNNFGIFDYCGRNGNIFRDECIEFINKVIETYPNLINEEFLNKYSRYGKNSILNICSDYASYFYERFYYLTEVKAVKYVNEIKERKNIVYKLNESKIDHIYKEALKEMNDYLENKFYPLLNKLISLGADINSKTQKKNFINDNKYSNEYFNNYGKITPLMYLLSYPYSKELIKLIDSNNIDINAKDNLEKTPFMYLLYNKFQISNISKNEYNTMFDFFNNNNKIDIDTIDSNGNSMFSMCLMNENFNDALKIYNKHKSEINVNRTNNSNKNGLLKQLFKKNKKNINFILKNFKEKIDTNSIDLKYKRNALHYTCINTKATDEIDFSIFSDLIKSNTSITQKDIYNRTPLFYLFIDNKNEIKKGDPISSLSYLLENYNNEININDIDINGNSLLFLATASNAIFCVSTLLSKGALIKGIKNKNDNNIFSFALLGNSYSIPELFSKVNDTNVFKEKMFVEENFNSKPTFYEREVEKKILNDNDIEIKNENEEDNLESFFNNEKFKVKNNSYDYNYNYNYNRINNQKNYDKEIDLKLEKLFDDENEGITIFQSNNNSFYNSWDNHENKLLFNDYENLDDINY